jgi:hypothetical protein
MVRRLFGFTLAAALAALLPQALPAAPHLVKDLNTLPYFGGPPGGGAARILPGGFVLHRRLPGARQRAVAVDAERRVQFQAQYVRGATAGLPPFWSA